MIVLQKLLIRFLRTLLISIPTGNTCTCGVYTWRTPVWCTRFIDVLLGADVFHRVIRHGRRRGLHGSPAALETCFGWVLTGITHLERAQYQIAAYVSTYTSDELLQKFRGGGELQHVGACLIFRRENGCATLSRQLLSERGRKIHVCCPLAMKMNATPLGKS